MPKRIQHGGITRNRLFGRTVILAAPTGGLEPAVLPKSFPGARLYYVVYPSAGSDPSAAQIKAGQDSTGANAIQWGVETARTTTGVETFAVDAVYLTASTSYKIAFVWSNGVTDSSVSVGTFSTTGAGVTGTLAVTNANDTSAATGTTTVLGTLARTNANDTPVASGSTTITGTLSRTNANDTMSASGSTTITGTVARTNSNDTLAASGSAGSSVTGTSATTNSNDTLSASGTTTIVGTLAKTNANDTVSASGSVGNSVTGTVAVTNSNDTLAASGTTTVTGALAKTNANDTSAASGTTTVTGALARTNANDTSSASGTTTITGTLARTNANDTVSASGVTGAITGTVNYTNANDTSTGGNLASSSRLGGFEYGSKVYIKRNKKIYIFDSVEEADSYLEAEAKVEEIVQQSNRTSRLARKRAREKAFKSLAIEPVDTVDIPALKTLVAQLQTDFELPKLIAQQDWQRVVEIYNQAMEMQDEEDLLLIL